MVTKKLCEQVIMMRHNPKYVGQDTFYSLGHFERYTEAEQAAKNARSYGYNARILQDFGNLVVIKPKSKSIGKFKDTFPDVQYDKNGVVINPPKGYRQAVPGSMGLVMIDRRKYKAEGKYGEKKPTRIGRFGNGEDKLIHANLAEEKKARAKLNKKLRIISDIRYKLNIPWNVITEAVISEGFIMPMLSNLDDNKPGRINVQIGNKTWLAVQWYPLQNDRFEITAYAS